MCKPDPAPCTLSLAPLGRVAEWQTRTVQVRVSVRTWGFNSPLAHPIARAGYSPGTASRFGDHRHFFWGPSPQAPSRGFAPDPILFRG